MAFFIFDVDTPREAEGVRPSYPIGPFADFDALRAWVDADDNDARLSLFWQAVTLPDVTGRLSIYSPERVARDLPVLHELPEAKAQFERAMAIQGAMERFEAEPEAFVEEHGLPMPPNVN